MIRGARRHLPALGWVLFGVGAAVRWLGWIWGSPSLEVVRSVGFFIATSGILILFAGPRAAWPSRDPTGYQSVALPTLALAVSGVLAVVMGERGSIAAIPGVAAFLIAAAFFGGGRSVWRPWARHVLRRPSRRVEAEFRDGVSRQLRAAIEELLAIDRDPAYLRSGLRQAAEFLIGLRQLSAPTLEWGALRDDYARCLGELLARAHTPTLVAAALQAWVDDEEIASLGTRFEAISSRDIPAR